MSQDAKKQHEDGLPGLQEPVGTLPELTTDQKTKVLMAQKRVGQLHNQILSAQVMIHQVTGQLEQANADLSKTLIDVCAELGVNPLDVGFNPDELKLMPKK